MVLWICVDFYEYLVYYVRICRFTDPFPRVCMCVGLDLAMTSRIVLLEPLADPLQFRQLIARAHRCVCVCVYI